MQALLSPTEPWRGVAGGAWRFLSVSAGRRRPDEDLAKKMPRAIGRAQTPTPGHEARQASQAASKASRKHGASTSRAASVPLNASPVPQTGTR